MEIANNKLNIQLSSNGLEGGCLYPAGPKGDTGVGITKIEKTATVGLVDTYTITFSDNSTTTFNVTNGSEGKSLEFNWNGTNLGVRVQGTTDYTYVDLKGQKGDKGDTGTPGISDIATTTSNGLMSSGDKIKLDGIATGAQVNVLENLILNGETLAKTNKAIDIKDSEVTNARVSVLKSKTFNNVNARIDDIENSIEDINRVRGHIYGVRRKITNNTSSAWERIEDSINLVANATKNGSAVQNDFNNLYPWSRIVTYNYDTTNKKITAYIGEPGFAFDGSNGEVLTRIPEFWYKREQKDGYEYIYIADYEAVGFIKSEQFSLGRYTMSGSSSRVYSKSGVNPLVSNTITNFRNYARNLNSNFGIMDWHYFVIQLLYLVEYADYNSQSKLGNGVNAKAWAGVFNGVSSGGCDSLGMKSGTLSDDNLHSVIYRGLEDIYAGLWQFVDGINIKDYVTYICYDSDKYSVDTFDGSYHAVGYTNFKTSGQWITKLGYDANNPLVAMPIEGNGSSSTGVCDLNWNVAGNMIALVGGAWYHGLYCGFWSWNCDNASSLSSTNVGARLLKNQ